MKINLLLPKSVLIRAAKTSFVALLLLASVGCGSTKVSTHTNTNSSVGQQLMDLKKAHDQGIIDDKEYEKLRQAIVDKNK